MVRPGNNGDSNLLLEIRNISKTFPGVKALNNVEITLRKGEVLGLCGENGAGKSTLMKILTGIYNADPGGEIYLQGKKVKIRDTNHAREIGLSIIHQEINLVPDLTVAQNLFLGRPGYAKGGVILDHKMEKDTQELLDRLNIRVDPKTYCRDLTVSRLQMVEIARALSYESRILIMDEPTAAITLQETEALFKLIHEFMTEETGLIYISHRMPEIRQITDRVSVLRDGTYVGSVNTPEVEMREIISMMVGRQVSEGARPNTQPISDEVVLKVENLNAPIVHNVSFELKRGEILGVAGLMGAGRTETARCISGADPHNSGTIFVNGTKVRIRNAVDGVKAGIGYFSEDRKRYGLLLDQDVKANTVVAALKDFIKLGFVQDRKISKISRDYAERLRIKTPSVNQLLNKLSGGNQQKVIIAKWLVRDCDILIFDEPTRGIDVGAKEEIYHLLEELTARGKSIIMISSELPEILRMSHRIMVMSEGRITGVINNAEATQENIMELATLGKDQVKGEQK